jgi:hypothetical protein
VGIKSFIVFLLIALGLTASAATYKGRIHLMSGYWYNDVGSTPFDRNNALDIAMYCDGDADVDSTACAQSWVQDAKDNGMHLYASTGTYTLSGSLTIFDGMHLQCESPSKVTFRKESGLGYAQFHAKSQHVTDILIENCGFDLNGDSRNFANAVVLDGGADQVTFRGNRVFDDTGVECNLRDCQRQYLVIVQATDILVENNHFSQGGRIKVGRPGRRIVIRDNILNFVNDNGITVVGRSEIGWPDGTNVSEDILIDGNTIDSPTVTGIFFGADGQPNGVGVTTRRVTIINNRITGALAGSCIKGLLPDHANEIFIANNRCTQEKPNFDWDDNKFVSGIRLARSDNFAGAANSINVARNRVTDKDNDALDLGAFFVDNAEVCLLDNVVRNSALAAWFRFNAFVHLNGNDWGGGEVRVDDSSAIVTLPHCFLPPFIR